MSETAAALLGLLLVPVLWALMWAGWRRRGRRQGDVPAPAQPARGPGPAAAEGVYVSTCRAGDWLDRVVVHGLGARSGVGVEVAPDGVALHRTGARSVLVPVGDLLGVRREAGMAGKVVGTRTLVVLTWRLGDARLDTGLRMRSADDADAVVAAVRRITGEEAA